MINNLKLSVLSIALLLVACGGGGDGDGTSANAGQPAAIGADKYVGSWATGCLDIPEAVAMVPGALLKEKLSYTFTKTSDNVLSYTFEVVLYTTAGCSGNAYMSAQRSTGEWTLEGAGDVANTEKATNRKITSPGISAGNSLVFNDVSLPGRYLVRRPPAKDIFQVSGSTLVTGNLSPLSAQGYPMTLNTAAVFNKK